jgi:dTMP kinase
VKQQGTLVSLEGIDGAGKTTLITALEKAFSSRWDTVTFREPGSTRVSEEIRRFLLNNANQDILSSTEAFLYAASRAQVVEECVAPALAAGKLVFLDRYIDSTVAYQGYGRGLDIGFLHQLNGLCSRKIMPQLTLLLDIAPQASRMRQEHAADRLEEQGLAFLGRVRDGYLRLAEAEPERILVLDAARPPEQVLEAAQARVEGILAGRERLGDENRPG